MIPWPILLAIFIVAVAIAATPAGTSVGDAVARGLTIVGRRDWLAMLFVASVAFVAAMLPSLVWSVPVPIVHDEFSYLLAGDTFAHRRLTNPPLPDEVWPSFETFHVIQRPTYASKFPPGQGVALAIGQLLTGRPIVGVWLSYAIACAAVTWMLRAALPPRYAVLGGLLVAMHPAVFWWSQTYWGGAVAMLGGALLTGAALRSVRATSARAVAHSTAGGPAGSTAQEDARSPSKVGAHRRSAHRAGPSPGRHSWTNGIIAGIGIAILANSRPFEGLILTVLVGALLLIRAILRRRVAVLFTRLTLPAALVLIPVAAFMLYYNWRVTGDALTLPYAVHAGQYMSAPLFFWQRPPTPPPTYRNREFARFHHDVEVPEFDRARTFAGRLSSAQILTGFAYPFSFLLPLVTLIVSRGRRRRLAIFAMLVAVAAVLTEMLATPWMRIAYLAPLMGLFALAVTVGLQQLSRITWPVRNIGRALVTAVAVTQLVVLIPWAVRLQSQNAASFGATRDRLITGLKQQPGKQLVFVRYGELHDPRQEWVDNGADLNAAPVIFARSLHPDSDHRVAEYFADRRLWLLDINEPEPPRIQPFPSP